jgi:cytochrome c
MVSREPSEKQSKRERIFNNDSRPKFLIYSKAQMQAIMAYGQYVEEQQPPKLTMNQLMDESQINVHEYDEIAF